MSNPGRPHWSGDALRFLLAGGLNTGLTLVLYWLLLKVTSYSMAYTFSFAAGIVSSFALNTYFVFKVSWDWKKFLAFPSVHFVNYLAGLSALWVLIHKIGVDQRLAPVLAIVVTLPLNFLMTRWLIRVKSDATGNR